MDAPHTQTYRPLAELMPPHWQQGDVEANGIRQHYLRTGGDKPTLLLLHGFMMAGPTWLRMAQALENEYDVIMPDARGHGRSDSGEVEEPTTLVEDTAAFIRVLGLNKPFVLGHSMGASTAIHLAGQYPELVRAMIAEDPGLRPLPLAVFESEGYKAWQAQWLVRMKTLPTMTHAEQIADHLANRYGRPVGTEAEVVAEVDAQVNFDLDMVEPFTYNSKRIPLKDVIPQVTIPQMVMVALPPEGGYVTFNREQGQQDRAEIEQHWQNGEMMVMEDCGHFIHLDCFDQFIEIVRRFFAKH